MRNEAYLATGTEHFKGASVNAGTIILKNRSISLIALSIFLFSPIPVSADEAIPEAMLVGVFHFANPGRDVVKVGQQINVLDEESQAYLEQLSARIVTEFNPTIILLEYSLERDELVQGRYQDYLDGTYNLAANEVYQLGFRIAKMAGGIPIASFDENTIHWDALPLLEILPTLAPAINEERDQFIADITREYEEDHRSKNLRELLQKTNDPEEDRRNMASYIMTNSVGVGENFEGATAASSWWHRNFRMYARIQSHATPGARILVIGGQGHTAILKNFLFIDNGIKGVDVAPLF